MPVKGARTDIKLRLWDKVIKTENDCWLWQGRLRIDGYGRIRYEGKPYLAHRLAYELVNGPVDSSLRVCHACDVRNCINPSHLWLGTDLDNVQDMRSKGRSNYFRGQDLPSSKLVDSQVIAIREALANKVCGPVELARRYGVSYSLVKQIRQGVIWKHLL